MNRFNIRVYGILVNNNNEVLLSDERIKDFRFTKYPGGGLEWGEGIIDCLKREWKEELNVEIEILEHIYTTDFFQLSAFDTTSQIISIYYTVKLCHHSIIDTTEKTFDFTAIGNEEIKFRWKKLSALTEQDLTLPIDKIVVPLITLK